MARIDKQTAVATSVVMGEDRQGVFTSPVRSSSYTVRNVTRGDIVKSPVVKGFRRPLPYSATGEFVSSYVCSGRCDYTIQGKQLYATYEGEGIGYFLKPQTNKSLISQNQINQSTVRLLKKIGDAKFSAGQALLELQESVDMIGKTSRTLALAMTAGLRKDWKSVAKLLRVKPVSLKKSQRDMANGWLAYSFGWSPLVDDISNAALALSGAFNRGDSPLLVAKERISESTEEFRSGQTLFAANGRNDGIGFGANGTIKYRFTHDYKASVYFEVDLSSLNELSRYGIIGLSTPWAVMPWSFLIDWVLPIGDILAAADATVGLTYKGGSFTHFQKCTASLEGFEMWTTSPWQQKLNGSVAAVPASSYYMNRAVWPVSPSPFQPFIKNPLSVWKAVTGIALFRQVKP